jgi:hypothetical protein
MVGVAPTMAYVMPHGVQLNFKATNRIFKADVRSFSVAEEWKNAAAIVRGDCPWMLSSNYLLKRDN